MSPRPLVSAAIIVKDEAEFLDSCLASIRAVCDEIVVVDTGSSDSSVDVAVKHGAVVGSHPWDDDFAAARNTALELATGEWILYIDADEQLELIDVEAARVELTNATDAVALMVLFRTRPHFSPYREYRLWRHRPDIRFVGRIHETIHPDLQRVAAEDGLSIRPSEHFGICHYGYEGDQTRKHLRNLPLLERRVVEYPERCYLWNHLASVRAALGDSDGARSAWDTGVSLVRTRGIVDTTDVLLYSGLAGFLLDKGEDITDLLDEAFAIAPWFHHLHWLAARNHRRHDRHADAIPHLRTLIAVGRDPVSPTIAYHNGIFTTWAWSALATCLYVTGDRAGALEAFERVLVEEPNNTEARTKVAALKMMLHKR